MTTVPASTRTTTITLGSASAGPFLVGFRIFDAGLDVYVNDVLRTDYTVSATFTNGFTDTASITFTAALPLGSVIRIDGDMPIARGAQYVNPDPNLTAKLNIELGRVWSGMQQLERDRSRGLRSTAPIDPIVPGPVGTALIRTATGYGTGPNAADIAGAQGYAADALVASTAAQAQAAILAGILAYGASAGAPAATNQAALVAALAAAGGGPVFVPWASVPYDFTSLTAQQIQLMWGHGEVRVAGVQQFINTAPYVGTDAAPIRVTNLNWQPDQFAPTVNGSLYNGAISVQLTRTGGYAGYGAVLVDVLVDSTTGQFDSGITSFVHARNQTTNNIFGAWFGAASARPDLGETITGGTNVGIEANVWGAIDIGLQADFGAPLSTVGIQSVPDAIPRRGAAGRGPVRNASFGYRVAGSIHGDKFWTGYLTSVDAIAPGGIAMRQRGGSTLALAPSHILLADGYYTNGAVFSGLFTDAMAVTGTGARGLNTSAATLSGSAFLMAANQTISWGGATITGGARGITQSIGAGSSGGVADDFTVFANNFAAKLIHARFTTVPEFAVNGKTPVPAPTLPPAASDLATAITLINAVRTMSVNNGMAA